MSRKRAIITYARLYHMRDSGWYLSIPGARLDDSVAADDEADALTAVAVSGWRYVGVASSGGLIVAREVTS